MKPVYINKTIDKGPNQRAFVANPSLQVRLDECDTVTPRLPAAAVLPRSSEPPSREFDIR